MPRHQIASIAHKHDDSGGGGGWSTHTDHTVTGDKACQVIRAPPVRAIRAGGQHDIAHIGGGIMDPDGGVVGFPRSFIP